MIKECLICAPQKSCTEHGTGRIILEPIIDDGYFSSQPICECPKFRTRVKTEQTTVEQLEEAIKNYQMIEMLENGRKDKDALKTITRLIKKIGIDDKEIL